MLNKHKLQRIAIATSALMAFGTTQLIANAETLTITGTVQGPTCSLNVGGAEGQTFSMALPTVLLASAASAATNPAGTVFGTAQTTTFSLTSGGSACNFAGGASGWDISIVPSKADFISTINGATYLSNMIDGANGGTNAVVKLTGGVTTATNDLTLTDAGPNYMSGGSTPFRALAASSIQLKAQFAQSGANTKPTSGNFSSTLTLGVSYK